MIRSSCRILMILTWCAFASVQVLAEETVPAVGDFLHRIALARQLAAVDGPDAQRLLLEAGVQLPNLELTAPLTEGRVAAISRSLGIRVRTSRPDAPFGNGSVSIFLDHMAAQAPASQPATTTGEPGPYPRPNDRAADPRTKGKGKKKGLPPVSESRPV